jgi:hypothetical protein
LFLCVWLYRGQAPALRQSSWQAPQLVSLPNAKVCFAAWQARTTGQEWVRRYKNILDFTYFPAYIPNNCPCRESRVFEKNLWIFYKHTRLFYTDIVNINY